MLIISERTRIVAKNKRQGEKNGRTWTSNDISFEDHGVISTLPFVPDRIYEKVEQNKEYTFKFYLNPQGRININDIELVK